MKIFFFFLALIISIGDSFKHRFKRIRLNTEMKSASIQNQDILSEILSVVLGLNKTLSDKIDTLNHTFTDKFDGLTHEVGSLNHTFTDKFNWLTHEIGSLNDTILSLNESFFQFKLDAGYTVESALRGVLASMYGDKYPRPITYTTSYLLIQRLPGNYLSNSKNIFDADPYLNYQKLLNKLMVLQ